MKIGTIWLAKLIGRFTSHFSATTGTLTLLSPKATVTSVEPLASGQHPAAAGDADHLVVGDGVSGDAGKVLELAVGQGRGEDHLLGVIAALELDDRGIDFEGLDLGRLGSVEGSSLWLLVRVEVAGPEGPAHGEQGREAQQGRPA